MIDKYNLGKLSKGKIVEVEIGLPYTDNIAFNIRLLDSENYGKYIKNETYQDYGKSWEQLLSEKTNIFNLEIPSSAEWFVILDRKGLPKLNDFSLEIKCTVL